MVFIEEKSHHIMKKLKGDDLMVTQEKIADLVLKLRRNTDEAEQFDYYIEDIVKGCKKEVLLSVLKSVVPSVEHNLSTPFRIREYISDEVDIVRGYVEEARSIIESDYQYKAKRKSNIPRYIEDKIRKYCKYQHEAYKLNDDILHWLYRNNYHSAMNDMLIDVGLSGDSDSFINFLNGIPDECGNSIDDFKNDNSNISYEDFY